MLKKGSLTSLNVVLSVEDKENNKEETAVTTAKTKKEKDALTGASFFVVLKESI